MRGSLLILVLFILCCFANGQEWKVRKHQNTRYYAIITRNAEKTPFKYTEVSELSENKAYVAKGDLYAYINYDLKEISPYLFVEASNFKNGYAIVGDSFGRSIINSRIQLVIPFMFQEVRLPVDGLIVVQSWQNTWGVYDVYGNEKLPLIYDLPPKIINRDKIIVRKADAYGVVNDCNEIIFPLGYQFIDVNGMGYKQGNYLRLFNPN